MRLFTLVFALLLFSNLHAQQKCSHSQIHTKSMASDSLDVLHYEIDLDIIYLSQSKIAGNTKLKIVPLYNNMNSISLDLQQLIVDSIFVDNSKITNWQYNDTLLQIPLTNAINNTDTIDCNVYYHGNPGKDPSGWGGFYFSNDSTFAFNMAVGMQDDPHNYGRIWYPCVDNFTDRATYEFNITVKNANTAICNGSLININNSGNTKTYKWILHHDIPTYLASVAIGPYVAIEDTFNSQLGPIPISIYVPQNKVSAAQASFANLKTILQAFETYYGPYRWERIGYVGIPFNSGAMEHATSIHIGLGYINGNLSYETLIAHELSHHWFGDLVTCHSAPDMWLNEGWASFSESMYQEYVYGRSAYDENIRNEHYSVITNTHKRDNAYLAVAGVPHSLTYGSTVYNKGASVAHSLRGYLGDDKFFNMLKAYMSQKAFSDQSSIDFRNFISSYTGISMNDFFAAWIFTPGFCQFDIDSFYVIPSSGSHWTVHTAVRQGLHHKTAYANSNRMPISFIDDNWNRKDTIIQFSGQYGNESFVLDFNPTAAFVDLNNTVADATIKYKSILKTVGQKSYAKSFFKMNLQQITDSALFQITHNWAAPDTLGTSYPGLHISSRRYWTVQSTNTSKFKTQGKFRYWRAVDMDNDIISSSQDSVIILYRKHGGLPWQRIQCEKQGSWISGYIVVDDLQNGEYAIAAYDYQHLGIKANEYLHKDIKLIISPNPSDGNFNFNGNFAFPTNVEIYDVLGKKITLFKMNTTIDSSYYQWNAEGITNGTYFVLLFDQDNNIILRTKIIKN